MSGGATEDDVEEAVDDLVPETRVVDALAGVDAPADVAVALSGVAWGWELEQALMVTRTVSPTALITD